MSDKTVAALEKKVVELEDRIDTLEISDLDIRIYELESWARSITAKS